SLRGEAVAATASGAVAAAVECASAALASPPRAMASRWAPEERARARPVEMAKTEETRRSPGSFRAGEAEEAAGRTTGWGAVAAAARAGAQGTTTREAPASPAKGTQAERRSPPAMGPEEEARGSPEPTRTTQRAAGASRPPSRVRRSCT